MVLWSHIFVFGSKADFVYCGRSRAKAPNSATHFTSARAARSRRGEKIARTDLAWSSGAPSVKYVISRLCQLVIERFRSTCLEKKSTLFFRSYFTICCFHRLIDDRHQRATARLKALKRSAGPEIRFWYSFQKFAFNWTKRSPFGLWMLLMLDIVQAKCWWSPTES